MRAGGGKVYLIYHGQDIKIVVERKIGVCKRLRLHALRGVHDEQRALAGGKGARDLVIKIHMAGSVYKIELVFFTVFRRVIKLYGARLYGDAALALKLHIVKYLLLHIALFNRLCQLQKAVGKRGFAVVYMRDYGKISDVISVYGQVIYLALFFLFFAIDSAVLISERTFLNCLGLLENMRFR